MVEIFKDEQYARLAQYHAAIRPFNIALDNARRALLELAEEEAGFPNTHLSPVKLSVINSRFTELAKAIRAFREADAKAMEDRDAGRER